MNKTKPNILLITSDQHRGDCLGHAGHPCVRTPHLDMLAREAVCFSQAYVDSPVCIPSRTTLITGVNAHNNGCPEYNENFRINRERSLFLGSVITGAGYQTALIGKTHWHTENHFRAGFETVIRDSERRKEMLRAGIYVPHHGIGANEFSPALDYTPPQFHKTNWRVTKSIDFMESRDRDQPFMLWTSLTDPHPSAAIHEPFYSMYDKEVIPDSILPEWAEGTSAPYDLQFIRAANDHRHLTPNGMRKAKGVYYGKITNIDHQLGRLFGALKRSGEWDNTIIIYSSDHGECLGDYGTFFKSNFTDPAARVPLIIKPAGGSTQRGKTVSTPVQWADIYPTLASYAGAAIPGDLDGRSLVPLMQGSAESVHELLHGQLEQQHMLHDGRYKYLYSASDGSELVFDKENDPQDRYDLSQDTKLTSRLRSKFIEHLRKEGHPHLKPDGTLLNKELSLTPDDQFMALGWSGLTSCE